MSFYMMCAVFFLGVLATSSLLLECDVWKGALLMIVSGIIIALSMFLNWKEQEKKSVMNDG